jgi:N-acetylmuramoyl-L-alanine amidase
LRKSILLTAAGILFAIVTVIIANNSSVFQIRVSEENLTPYAKKQVECLADNMFFEAGYEPAEGQKAVAVVTLNRVRSGDFASDICGVVKEKNHKTCQFSWYCQDRERKLAYNKETLSEKQKEVYKSIFHMALDIYLNSDSLRDNTGGALYYHADYVSPNWRHLNKTVKIGRHIFYKPGEKYAKHDAKVKSGTQERQLVALFLPTYGGH